MTKTFRDLDVDPALCDALAADGITTPFPIQELTLPLALEGHDLIGQARTGTGKTLAFGLPLLQRVDPSRSTTQALVIVPTRELCLQVYEDLKIGASRGVTSINVYGGVAYEEQTEALTGGVHVVVGTPGRLLDHLDRGNLDLSGVTELVLDEADEMLDMGFLPDVERLVEACKGAERHTMLFSATMPTAIVKLARRYMHHPTFTRADHEERSTAPKVEQHFFQVHRMDKPRLLARILQTRDRRGVFVFVRTKHMADRLVEELEGLATPAIAVHGDLRQSTREKNLERFRRGEATVLVCTEVAARGLDVTGVTHVVNYDCPDDEKMYLHRIGRTARAGEEGVAITFAEFNEIDRLSVIRKAVGASERAVQQVFSTSPALSELFELPEERPWDHLAKGGPRGSDRSKTERKPKGRSDGRPKTDRAREGRGGRHDAQKRAGTPTGEERQTAPSSEERQTAATGEERPKAAATSKKPSEAGTRTRRRTRTRTEDAGGRPVSRDTARRESGQGERAEADSSRDTTTTQPDTSRPKRPRARRGGSSGADSERAAERAPHADSDGAASRAAPDAPERGDEGARDRGRSSGGRDDSKGDTAGTKGSGDSGKPRGGGKQPRGRRGGSARDRGRGDSPSAHGGQDRTQRSQPRGADARGDGRPQPARRVKVEHLP